jgi:UDP-glucose 4-epimerase
MTRFLLPLEDAVNTIFACLKGAKPGEIYVPKCPAANIRDLAEVMVGDSGLEIKVVGIRPGEKEHESLVSDEESHRTTERDGYYVVQPILPELQHGEFKQADIAGAEYDSRKDLMSKKQIQELLEANDLLRPHAIAVRMKEIATKR